MDLYSVIDEIFGITISWTAIFGISDLVNRQMFWARFRGRSLPMKSETDQLSDNYYENSYPLYYWLNCHTPCIEYEKLYARRYLQNVPNIVCICTVNVVVFNTNVDNLLKI